MNSSTTVTPTTSQKHYYAIVRPRGFANEADVVAFDAARDRDAFVDALDRTGRNESRTARSITRAEARRILGQTYCGTDQNFIRGVNVYLAGDDASQNEYLRSDCAYYSANYVFPEFRSTEEDGSPRPDYADGFSDPLGI